MTSGEKWRRFVEAKGWMVDNVIRAGDEGKLCIGFDACVDSSGSGSSTCSTALYLEEFDILCCESSRGTIFFQWDSITFIKLEPPGKKKWL